MIFNQIFQCLNVLFVVIDFMGMLIEYNIIKIVILCVDDRSNLISILFYGQLFFFLDEI